MPCHCEAPAIHCLKIVRLVIKRACIQFSGLPDGNQVADLSCDDCLVVATLLSSVFDQYRDRDMGRGEGSRIKTGLISNVIISFVSNVISKKQNMNTMSNVLASTRIDKWLWAARFFKTRSLATDAIELGRVLQNEQRVKPAHNVKVGDMIEVRQAEQVWTIKVSRILDKRGSASIAQTMYEETAASIALRQQVAESKKYFREPSAQLAGRPTKRDRRLIDFTRSE